MKIKLTTAKIEKLEGQEKQYLVYDERFLGLGLRVSPKGSKSFIYQGRIGGVGEPIRVTLGKYPMMSLQEAIDLAIEYNKDFKAGIDPRRKKHEQIAKNKAFAKELVKNSLTFGELYTHYIEENKNGWSQNYIDDHYEVARPYLTDRQYKTQPIGKIWGTPLSDLTPDFVEKWLKKENETRPTVMSKAFRMFKACANWAEETEKYEGLIPHKTYNSRKVNKSVQKAQSHKTALQKQQLKTWFEAIEGLQQTQRSALICMLLNGSRPAEMLSLKWSNVDFTWKTITIIDKVDQWERVIPLTPYTKKMIEGLPRINEFVFANENTKTGYVDIGKNYRELIKESNLPPLPPKTMRKSFSNLSEWVDLPYGVVKQIMGHRPSAVDEKHYKDRPIDLLRKWHIKLEEFILQESGITPSYPPTSKPHATL